MTNEEIEIFEKTYNSVKDPIILLKAVFKTGTHIVQPAMDEKSGWYAGVERLSEDDKKHHPYYVDPVITKLKLADNYQFNLGDSRDAINWQWVSRLPIIAGSFEDAQHEPRAMFYVHIEGREAANKINRATEKYTAMDFILKDNPSNYVDRALILGQDFEGEHPNNIKEWLLNKAENEPKTIIDLYNAKNTGMQLMFLKAKSARIIVETREGVVKFENKVLGLGDDGALAYLMSDDGKEVAELVKRRVYPEYTKTETHSVAPAPTASEDLDQAAPEEVSETSVDDLIQSAKED